MSASIHLREKNETNFEVNKKTMKKIIILLLLLSNKSIAQEIPNVALENLEGESILMSSITTSNEKPIVFTFWATWCIPCLNELSTINDELDEWKAEYKFDLYAVSVDDDRTVKKVSSIANGKNWDFEILLDTNQNLKRQLNINSIPYMIIVKNGKVIYKKSGFVKGEETIIKDVIANNQ